MHAFRSERMHTPQGNSTLKKTGLGGFFRFLADSACTYRSYRAKTQIRSPKTFYMSDEYSTLKACAAPHRVKFRYENYGFGVGA
jgi:hypothetical protein